MSIILLDGGMGREIKARLPQFDPILWSASAFNDYPTIIQSVHDDFIKAGAQVITTNNYAVVPSILKKTNQFDSFEHFSVLSGKIANQAVVASGLNVEVAGCLPPLQSTYRPDLVLPNHEGIPIYERIIDWLDPYCDLFLCESMSSISEAKMALSALSGCIKPIWISFLLDDHNPETLLSGEKVTEIVPALMHDSLAGILFNCCQPSSITSAMPLLNFSGRKGGYANAFKPLRNNWDHSKGILRETDEELVADYYLAAVKQWIDAGATIVGGCCGIGPNVISQVNSMLKKI